MNLFQLIKPYRKPLFVAVVLTSLESVSVLLLPWLAGRLLGSVFSLEPFSINQLFLFLVGTIFAYLSFKLISYLWLVSIFEKILADLKLTVFTHVQALPISFHNRSQQGDLLALVTSEVTQLSNFMTTTLVSFLPMVFTLLGAAILLVVIDASLALLVLLLLPFSLVVIKLFARNIRHLGREYQRRYSKNTAIASENISLIRLIKHFAKEEAETKNFRRSVDDLKEISVQVERVETYLDTAIQVLAFSAMLALLWLTSDRLNVDQMESSEAFSFLLYAVLLTRPLSALMSVFGQWQSARGNLTRLTEIMSEQPENLQQHTDSEMPRGDIEFNNVEFSYDSSRRILNSVSGVIREGEVVAILGENGAGKTTLFNLLVRFFSLDSGSIKIGDTDINEVNLSVLRRGIGVVSQHAELKNGTLRENLTYGLTKALQGEEFHGDSEALIEAVDRVQLTKFVESLPQGLDTEIGENGIQLSGGQRQKVALARTLLVKPAILLLDEATSMFDEKAEQAFIHSCQGAFANTTVLINSHRPSILALADRTLRMHDGKLHEEQARRSV